ncbi:hypothetical protein [Arsukibacterium ikkense]|uniref:hypothetical protein n=1 Tax=Arsukibacterium ikkense TaxID=336831 RepID=UPI00069A947B|nr:hypothetical protein [Arsukibacterium ikkense]
MLIRKNIIWSTVFAIAAFNVSANSDLSGADSAKLNQLWENTVSHQLAPIKSTKDLYKLDSNKSWESLTEYAKNTFVESLVINDKGLAGFNYAVLEAELTVSEIYSILSLFGAQRLASLMTDAIVESETDVLLLNNPQYRKSQKTDLSEPGGYQIMNGGGVVSKSDQKGKYCHDAGQCLDQDGAICTTSC